MIIRSAKKSDIPELLVLIESVVKHHVKIDSYYKPFSEYSGLEEEIGDWLSSRDMLVLIAENGGELIGYAQVSVEDAPIYASVKKIGVVHDMFVSEQYRRKKIAQELFQKSMDWFDKKKVEYIELSVDARNVAGVKYWESLGFFPYKFRMRKDL